MSCPDPIVLSAYGDGALEQSARPALTAHLASCERCRRAIDEDRRLGLVFDRVTCPPAETLAGFVDDALPPEALERTASHVLACEDCRDVVGWTREGQAHVATRDRRATGRRRRARVTRAPGRRGTLTPLFGGIAAAAAVLLVGLLSLSPRAPQPSGPTARVPDEAPDPIPAQPDAVQVESPTDGNDPSLPGDASGVRPEDEAISAPVDPESERPPTETTETPTKTPTETPTEPGRELPATPDQPEVAEVPPSSGTRAPAETSGGSEVPHVTLLALAPAGEPDLVWQTVDRGEVAIDGEARLPVGARLLAPRGGGFRLAGASCSLGAQAAVGLAAEHLELFTGELVLDAPAHIDDGGRAGPTALAIAWGAAELTPSAPRGARVHLEASGDKELVACVLDGELTVRSGDSTLKIAAGGAARVRNGRVRALENTLLDARLRVAREAAARAARVHGVDVPRGMLVRQALDTAAPALDTPDATLAASEGPELAQAARAAFLVQAVRGSDARLSVLAGAHLGPADRALDALLARSPEALARSGALAPTALALASRLSRDPDADQAPAAGLHAALIALAPGDLAQDREALLAVRALERAAGLKTPRAVSSALADAAAPRATAYGELATALLAGRDLPRALRARRLEAADARLAVDPEESPIEAELLLAIEQDLAVGGGLRPAHETRLLAHAAARREASLTTGLVLSHATAQALGARRRQHVPASSLVAVPAGTGHRVTFFFQPEKRQREVRLVGSWDNWREDATVMQLLPDGTYTATIELAAGRYDYKLILEGGDVWTTDPLNPLQRTDEQGRVNSTFTLD